MLFLKKSKIRTRRKTAYEDLEFKQKHSDLFPFLQWISPSYVPYCDRDLYANYYDYYISMRNQKYDKHIKWMNERFDDYFMDSSFLRRDEIRLSKRGWSVISDKLNVPPNLALQQFEVILQRADNIYDLLDAEYHKVKMQVRQLLGPSNTWALANKILDNNFIRFMAKNLKICIKNERVKIGFLIWDELEDLVNKNGGNIDVIFKECTKCENSEPCPKGSDNLRYQLDLHRRFKSNKKNKYYKNNQCILDGNLNRYNTTKEKLLECYRLMDICYSQWADELGYDKVHSDKHSFV